MDCPGCGKEMEQGYLTVPLHYGMHSMKWSRTPEHHVLDGDIIYDPKQNSSKSLFDLGSALAAYRCRACNCVVFYYPPAGNP